MIVTYPAILRGETLEWVGDKPKHLIPERPILVQVAIPEDTSALSMKERGKRMAAALEKIAQTQNSFSSVDPLLLEREMRAERQLPGRSMDFRVDGC